MSKEDNSKPITFGKHKKNTHPIEPKQEEKPKEDVKKVVDSIKESTAIYFNTKGSENNMIKPDKYGNFDYSGCKAVLVKDGDKLVDIANENHVALQQLRYFNKVNKHTLKIKKGQTIYIPSAPVDVPVEG